MKFKRAIEELKEEEGITLEQEYTGGGTQSITRISS